MPQQSRPKNNAADGEMQSIGCNDGAYRDFRCADVSFPAYNAHVSRHHAECEPLGVSESQLAVALKLPLLKRCVR